MVSSQSPHPIRKRVQRWLRSGAVAAGTCLLAFGFFCALVAARERAWPWLDRAPSHGWLHCVNDTGGAVAWGLRFDGATEWSWYRPDWFDGEPEPSRWRPEREVLRIVPGCDEWAGQVREVRVEHPGSSDLPAAAWSFAFEPGGHFRLRADRSGQLFVSSGAVTWLGNVSFGPERAVAGP
ncbi:MAG TPA: hypothetical protein VFY71_16595 [Planctomycetota bacterium]|nr:hypothetical protein [Planctomycetota bacterium]